MKAYESLGVSAEDYLEAILVLERQLGAVRSIDVARWLDAVSYTHLTLPTTY